MEGKKKGSIRSIFMHSDKIDLVLMVLGFVGAVADGLVMPFTLLITSSLMNDIGISSDNDLDSNSALIQSVNKNALLLCYVASGAWFLCFLEGYCWTRTAERQAARMRVESLRAVLRQDISFFDLQHTNTSEIVTIVSNDSLVMQDCIAEKVPNFVMNLASFFGNEMAAFLMAWKLAIVELPFVILLVIPGLMYGRLLMGTARKIREEYKEAGSIVEQAIASIRTVYAFVGEADTISRFSSSLQGSMRLGLKQGLAKGFAIGSSCLILGVSAFNCWYGSRLVINHGIQGGTVFAVGATIVGGGYALGSALSNVRYLSEAASTGERIMEMTIKVPTIDVENTNGEMLENFRGDVEFKNVDFAYPSRSDSLVLEDFSLRILAGQKVGLVGKSGCGKSTVISLLQRFYEPLGGKILMDDVAIERFKVKWLRSQMGLVSQEPCLFDTTIRENILFGKDDASMDEVIEVAKAANAHAFISQLPLGYDTQVGERGVQVSGGQKQRIAIARAIIRNPRILLLDEATSALDSESERLVQDALDMASVGRTTIVVAHRLSTICNSDTIVVIQDGKVAQAGPHDELIQDENGLYLSLVQTQETRHETNEESYMRSLSIVSRTSSHRSFNSIHGSDAQTRAINNNNNAMTQDHRPKPSLRRLLTMNLPEWRQASLGCISAILVGAVQPVYAFIMGAMIWSLFLRDHKEMERRIRVYAGVVGGLAGFTFMINVSQHWSFAYMGECLTKRLRETMLSKILTFEVGWFEQEGNSTGALCSRLAKDANVVRSLVGDRMALIVQTFSATATACIIGLAISWRLASVMIAVQPLVIACYYTRRILIKSMSAKAAKAQSQSSALAADSVSNIRTVAAFSAQLRILRLLTAAQEAPHRESLRQSWYAGIGLAASQAVMTCTWALDFWYGGRLVAAGVIGAQSLFQVFMILVSTGKMIADVGSVTTDLAKGADSVGSVFAVLDRVSRIEPDDHDGFKPCEIVGSIGFHDVCFVYPSRPEYPVLENFSLTIRAGKSTALVGKSGSGKSTIIALIERFYDPIRGSIKIDGRDLRSFDLRSLRKHIALVSQEPILFSGTIRENIAFGMAKGADEAELVASAKAANAHDMISGLKDGYNTRCGDRGVQLSGGQKQRIVIARAMLRNPKILLLDEATSALDGQSEKAVQEALERVMVGRTGVVVAHRVSAVRGCDEIAVVEKGRVAERGTHLELMAKGPPGKYYSLVSMQTNMHHD
ncbi:hypothetical protein V2J09_012076 [Rumex salicifolius]